MRTKLLRNESMAMRRLLLGLIATALAGTVWLAGQSSLRAQPSLTLPPIERLVVEKSTRRMLAYSGGRLVQTFEHIQLGDAPVGAKQFQGDEKTPEGSYTIDYGNPRSAYHLSLHISYPGAAAKAAAARAGRSPGGDIFIHGQPNYWPTERVPGDWTDGCIAVSNAEIEALWEAVGDGTPIEIRS